LKYNTRTQHTSRARARAMQRSGYGIEQIDPEDQLTSLARIIFKTCGAFLERKPLLNQNLIKDPPIKQRSANKIMKNESKFGSICKRS
jgi:hypothetical protein